MGRGGVSLRGGPTGVGRSGAFLSLGRGGRPMGVGGRDCCLCLYRVTVRFSLGAGRGAAFARGPLVRKPWLLSVLSLCVCLVVCVLVLVCALLVLSGKMLLIFFSSRTRRLLDSRSAFSSKTNIMALCSSMSEGERLLWEGLERMEAMLERIVVMSNSCLSLTRL